jgi:hypothetical protein
MSIKNSFSEPYGASLEEGLEVEDEEMRNKRKTDEKPKKAIDENES